MTPDGHVHIARDSFDCDVNNYLTRRNILTVVGSFELATSAFEAFSSGIVRTSQLFSVLYLPPCCGRSDAAHLFCTLYEVKEDSE